MKSDEIEVVGVEAEEAVVLMAEEEAVVVASSEVEALDEEEAVQEVVLHRLNLLRPWLCAQVVVALALSIVPNPPLRKDLAIQGERRPS